MNNQKVTPYLLLVMAILSIQFGASIAKELFTGLGVIATAGFRLFFASIILCLIFRPWKKDLRTIKLKSVISYGIALSLMNILFYLSLEKIPLGIAVALEFTGPLGLSFILTRRLKDFIWPILAIIGVILLIPMQKSHYSLDPLGVIYALGAGLAWGLYIIFGKKASGETDERTVVSLGMLFAAIFIFPLALIDQKIFYLNLDLLPKTISVAILSSALPYTLEIFVLKKMHPKNFGILMSLEPAVATFFGYVYLSESLSLKHIVAIFLIITASLGSSFIKTNDADEILNDLQ